MKKSSFLKILGILAILGVVAFTACPPEPSTYTVTFNANGGTPEPQKQTIESGKKATEPAPMEKNDYSFDGWYTDNTTFANAWNFATNTVTANVTLYAKWVKEYANSDDKIHITFGENSTTGEPYECDIPVKGIEGETFTDTEWENILDKIGEALAFAYVNKPETITVPDAAYRTRFRVCIATTNIIVKTFTTPNTDKSWETTKDQTTLYINRTKIDGLSNLGLAMDALRTGTATVGPEDD